MESVGSESLDRLYIAKSFTKAICRESTKSET